MQKILLSILSFLALTLASGSFARDQINVVYEAVDDEIAKDLAGKKSCFKGAVKKKMEEMHENYGGRFGGSYNLEVIKISETQYRYAAKYCEHYLDSELNILPDHAAESLRAYRQCTHTNESLNIAGVTFDSTTSGTFEKEGLIFKVNYTETNSVIVKHDAGYHADENEIKSWNTSVELSCSIVE